MKLRLKQGGIVKLQNAAETIPTVIVADPMSQRISQNNHLAQIMERDATKAEWERKVEAAEKKADERINNEDNNLASQFMFSGETGEWSKGANTNARRAKYVAEELGLDGNKAFLDSYKKDGKTGAIAFGTTLLTAPMAGEFATYGLLGGAARLAGGMAGSTVGSWGLGKVGDWADNQLGTNWMGTTGRIVGGFAGFGAGMGATTPVLRRLATKGITLHMPWKTFMKLRSEGFHKNADRVAKSLFKTKYIVNPEEQLMNEITDVPKGKGWQFHVDDFYKTPDIDWETGRPISTSFNKQYYENGLIKPGKSYIDPSGESDYIWFKEDVPYIKPKHSNIIKGLSEDLNTKTNQLVSGQPNPFPLSKGFDPNKPSIEIYEYYPLGNIKMNPKLHLNDQSVGTWGKVIFHTPNQPQSSATTYEIRSLRVPKNRPISEAERLGIPKGERSNPKALEDPYYWGYKQWNNRYNGAVETGNWDEAQRLRDLHFTVKAPNTKIIDEAGMPKEVYHGSGEKFTVFDSSKTRPDYDYGTSTNMFSDNKNVALGYANNDPDKLHSVYLNLQNILERDFKGNSWNGSVNNSGRFAIVPSYETTYSSKQEAETALQKMLDLYYPNNPAKQVEQRHYMYVKELADSPHLERSTNAFSDEIANSPILDGGIIKNVKDYYNLPKFDENPELYKELTSPHTDYFVKDPRNIKSSAIITHDDFGRIIPIVKRDNFRNPDIRYKQGGNLKMKFSNHENN